MKSENIEPQNTQNTQKYIMVQERDKKKVFASFCVVCGSKHKEIIRVIRAIRWQNQNPFNQ